MTKGYKILLDIIWFSFSPARLRACMRVSPVPALLLHLIFELHLAVQLFLQLVDPLLQILQLDTDRKTAGSQPVSQVLGV